MSEQGAYGQRLGSRFNQEQTCAIVTRALRKTEIAVTEVYGNGNHAPFMSGEIPKEDAYLIGLAICDHPHIQVWEEGRTLLTDLKAGETMRHDLKRNKRILVDKPHHSIHFYLPRSALNAIADEASAPRIGELEYELGIGIKDDTIKQLGQTMLGALDHLEQVSRVFADHVTLALAVHVAHTYGGMRTTVQPLRGGLAPPGRNGAPRSFSMPISTATSR